MPSLSPILDVIIGLAGVYIAFSLLASWLQERVAAFFNLRSTGLVNGIYQLFNGNVTAFSQFVQDPIFQALMSAGKSALPAPVTAAEATAARVVAQAAVDLNAAAKTATGVSATVATGAGALSLAAKLQRIAKDPTPNDVAGVMKDLAKNGPSYVSKEQFGAIFMNLVAQNGAGGTLKAAAAMLQPPPPAAAGASGSGPAAAPNASPAELARQFADNVNKAADALGVGAQMNALLSQAGGDSDKFLAAVENWYDDHMDRVSGWYKRKSHTILIVIGLLLAVLFNVDSVRLYTGLSCNSALRGAAAIAAAKVSKETATTTAPGTAADAAFVTGMLNAVPIGWPDTPLSCTPATLSQPQNAPLYLGTKLLGFIITMLALSLGAPFWFDTLSRLTNVRAAGNKPDTDRKKA
ncbi:MAG TPA: hypothetical protein VGD01_05365 [Candidatus Elarobacter sp.]|jgi:hypothetical protein